MSSRAPPPHLSPRDRDRRYTRDDRDDIKPRARSRSRSPRRDRDRYEDRDRRYDRDQNRGSYRDERSRRDYDSPRDRERDKDVGRGDINRETRREDIQRGELKRDTAANDMSRDASRAGTPRVNPNNDPNYRPSPKPYDDRPPAGSVAPAYGRGGYGARGGQRPGPGGYGGRGDGYEQPLDRRAIEEGRRRREEERAKGMVYTEGGMLEKNAEDESAVKEEPQDEVDPDDPEAQMAAMMGFGGFNTSKGKGKEDNIDGVAKVNKQRTWRQYMNRRGGFNRPLDKIK
ncbi:uncharacterized protein IL334_006716 [Kwoniella shivajii]|uniref:U4/U6.U5 small nuclear ribonucleoprotein 27kDa protein domain-containing protein n=1 Tax=Kwoniella shivajii TaxID=564305 RepID=A0ABZ1D9S1_9TREE|nr:hypothetical protein IL334_006716 [Kwoniella shivajii]